MSSMDLAAIMAVALVIGISMLLGWTIIEAFKSEGTLPTTPLDQAESAITSMDALVAFVIGAVCLASVLLAFLVRSHPAFFFVSFIITLILIPLSGVLGNIYYEFAHTDSLSAAANEFPLTYATMEYLPKICVVFSGLIAVVMYGKAQNPYGVG